MARGTFQRLQALRIRDRTLSVRHTAELANSLEETLVEEAGADYGRFLMPAPNTLVLVQQRQSRAPSQQR